MRFAVYQATFAGITVAIISGAVVERLRFAAYLPCALLWTTLVAAVALGRRVYLPVHEAEAPALQLVGQSA